MAKRFNKDNIEFKHSKSPIEAYAWLSSSNIASSIESKHMDMKVRILEADHFSYPYHYHHNAEEVFVVLEGEATLRTPEGLEIVKQGDVIFFEIGETGAHQLHNHTTHNFKYLDIRTVQGFDVCEYPDSNKVNILPDFKITEKGPARDYFDGEDNVREIWHSLREEN